MKSGGFTLVEMMVTMSVIVGIILAGLSILKADQGGQKQRAAVDAVASMIRIGIRQASANNINLAITASGGSLRVMGCGVAGAPCTTPYTSIDPVQVPNIAIPDGLLLGLRKDGIVASKTNWNLNNMFGSLLWGSKVKLVGTDQSYLLDIGRYGDVDICDGALNSCNGQGAR